MHFIHTGYVCVCVFIWMNYRKIKYTSTSSTHRGRFFITKWALSHDGSTRRRFRTGVAQLPYHLSLHSPFQCVCVERERRFHEHAYCLTSAPLPGARARHTAYARVRAILQLRWMRVWKKYHLPRLLRRRDYPALLLGDLHQRSDQLTIAFRSRTVG